MFNKYKRTNFLPTVETENGLEKDLIMSHWDLFKIKRPLRFDIIRQTDLKRPDLFSLRLYRNITYWWIISKYNRIDDWFNDVYVGMDIAIPDVQDIEDYYLEFKSKVK
jgi:hypothetical protein